MSAIITPQEILTHIVRYLPIHTDLFSEAIDVASAAAVSSNTVRVVTNTDHGLNIGEVVVINSGLLQNSIDSVVLFDNDTKARLTTEAEHDFTLPQHVNDTPTSLTMSGFTDGAWNNEHLITDVENRKTFVIPAPSAASPTLTGAEIVYEDRPKGVKSAFVITTVPTTTSFEFEILTSTPSLPVNPITGLTGASGFRMSAASSFDRAEAAYTKITVADDGIRKSWLYLIMTGVDVSKDRHTLNDSIASFSNQDEARILLLTNFAILVFFDTSQSLTGARAQQIAYGELYEALIKTLYGFKAENEKSRFLTITNGHGVGDYNSSYYTQAYEWQIPQLIDWSFGFSDPQDVSFRNYNMDLHPFNIDNPEKLEIKINLDEVPL